MDKTIQYYNENAESYFDGTVNALLQEQLNRFLNYIPKGGRILDLGCGSGRDTKYFLEQGYLVDAIDGSEELCKMASRYTGISVMNKTFDEVKDYERYDGIWACASLLHVPVMQMFNLIEDLAYSLKPQGVIYIAMKYGEFSGYRSGRFFADWTPRALKALINSCEYNVDVETSTGYRTTRERLSLLDIWETGDVRPERNSENWVNVLAEKFMNYV